MNRKKIIATFLLVMVFSATAIGWGGYRLALATDTTTEVTVEKLEEASTAESTTSESTTEVTTASEATTENVNLVEDEQTAYTPSDLVTETTTETTSEVASKDSSEISIENTTTQVLASEDGSEVVTQSNSLAEDEVSSDTKGDTQNVKIRDTGKTWGGGGHWYWYTTNILPDNNPPRYWHEDKSAQSAHMVFCLNPGYTMNRGDYTMAQLNHTMFRSKSSTCLINTAIEWYKRQVGDLGRNQLQEDKYQTAQLAIWGTPGSNTAAANIIEYATHANNLLSASAIGKFKANGSSGTVKPSGTTYTTSANADLNYWANSSTMNSHKGYSFSIDNGSSSAKATKAEITSEGKIKVTFSGKLGKDDKITVSLNLSGDCMGANDATTWVNPGNGLQNLSMGSFTSSKTFSITFGGKSSEAHLYPNLYIPKQDILGNDASATYRIWWGDAATQKGWQDFSNNEWVDLKPLIENMVTNCGITFGTNADGTAAARYADLYWQETSTDPGLILDTTVHRLRLNYYHVTNSMGTFIYSQEADGSNVVSIKGGSNSWVWMICNGIYGDATTDSFSNGQGYDGAPALCWYGAGATYPMQYTYAKLTTAFTNNINSYGYSFLKHGENITISGTKGNVTYNFPSSAVDTGAEFALYCDSSISRSNGTPVFSAGQQITSGTTWCGSSCNHTPSHVVQLSGGGVNAAPIVAQNGKVSVTGLPEGSYHFVEVKCGSSFILNPAPIYFDVGPDSSGDSNEVQLNTVLKAKVSVKKLNANTGKYLAGAEFTLYAKNTNTNNAGQALYPADWAEKALSIFFKLW